MSYSQRKFTMTKADKAALSKWAAQKPKADDGISERRRELWDRLCEFIQQNGGSVVSVKHQSPMRIEAAPDSTIPQQLRDLGYGDLTYCEQTTRIGAPVSARHGWRHDLNTSHSFHTVDVYELRLPK